jgi:hypothetical protein
MSFFWFSFTKSGSKRAEPVLPGLVGISRSLEEVGKVKEGEHGTNTAYTCM